jgi:ubiquinone/menaquinone biosynthesis C-methylase UbiE
MNPHHTTVVDQFTLQADAFAAAAAIRDDEALELLLSRCVANSEDESLDVACGPGLVVCAFAEVVKSATGIDLTPAIVEKGRLFATAKNLNNTSFSVGDVSALPFDTGQFSIVTSRYAFHHFPDPARVLLEMVRVCKPGGRIAVMDMVASDDPEKADRFNRMEKLRDPSHVAALTLSALVQTFQDAGLPTPAIAHYKMPIELEGLLNASFPNLGDRELVREMVVSSLAGDAMGVQTRRKGDKVYFSYPIAILVATPPKARVNS